MRYVRAGFSLVLMIAILPLVACSTHNTTLVSRDAGQVIYPLTEEQAFTLVIDAYADVLPKQSLDDITGARRGYESTWRWGLDTYSQKTLVVPAIGTDHSGREVRGYWFEVSGSGSSGSGRSKNLDLFRTLKAALDATGAAVVVTNLREGRYETDGLAYRAGSRDARDVAASRTRAP